MARRDNQGIQIAMIVFILTTLMFMVGTYLGYSSWASVKGELEQAKADSAQSAKSMQDAVRAASGLKTSIGLDPSLGDDAAEAEAKKYVEDVLGQGLPEESRNFLGIVRAREARIADLTQQLAETNSQVRKSAADMETLRKTTEEMIANAKEAEAQAVADLAAREKKFLQDMAAYKTTNDQLTADKRKMQADLNKAVSEANKQVASATTDQAEARRRAKMLQEQLNVIKKDTPDQYDGRVLGAIAKTKTVLLDIGRADGVRPKLTFGVYDAEDSNVRTAAKKATIEIVRVLSDNRSEARIIDANYTKPIVNDDFIYSPIWSPGTRLGIALVGDLDMDSDGRDDREYIKNLIELNGGRVDAEVVDGKLVGKMSVNTRYIVVGEDGLSGASADLIADAERLTIEQMSLNELMDLMGSAGRARSVAFGTGVPKPGDFAPLPRANKRVSTGSTSFRERTPTPRRRRVK